MLQEERSHSEHALSNIAKTHERMQAESKGVYFIYIRKSVSKQKYTPCTVNSN